MCKMVDEAKNQKGVSYSAKRLPNQEAIIHFQGKTLLTSESYFDVKAYEHALAFTVAKIADEDLLKTVRDAIQSALENGTDFRTFKRTLLPYLNAQGWGNFTEDKQLLDRRLRTIFNTNMSSSYSAGQWQRIQKTKEFLPYLKYMPSLSANKRDEHKQYYGIVRPVDDPIWQSIFPKNGYGCRCWVKQLTQRQAEKEGISDPVDLEMETVENPRTGEKMITPKGVHFNFNHNHDRLSALLKLAEEKHGTAFGNRLHQSVEGQIIDEFSKILSPEQYFDKMTKGIVNASIKKYFENNPQIIEQARKIGLNDFEIISIMSYTHLHGYIQQFLRNPIGYLGRNLLNTKLVAQQYQYMKMGLAKLPDYIGQVTRVVEMYDAIANLKVGDIFSTPDFMSCTYDNTDVFSRANKVRLILQLKTGKKIDMLSIKPRQKEVLVLPHTQFKVTDIQKGEDICLISMTEI